MLKKLMSDALGLSDIGSVFEPADYDKVDADDYVMYEDGEKMIFLIKSKTDEYCFTNKALIHVDGASAVSKKRTLRRFDYSKHPVQDVTLETAGMVDMDVEIKFSMGELSYSIDVNKKHIEELKDLYKALIAIGVPSSMKTPNAFSMPITVSQPRQMRSTALLLQVPSKNSSKPLTNMPSTGCNKPATLTWSKTLVRFLRNLSRTRAC